MMKRFEKTGHGKAEKKEFPLPVAAVCGKTVCLYTGKQDLDEKGCIEYVKSILKNNKIDGISMKIYKELPAYLDRLDEMNEKIAEHPRKEKEEKEILNLLGLISY